MLAFDTSRFLRNGKKYKTATNTNISENSSSGNDPAMGSHEDEVSSESEAPILTQEDINEQIRCYIAFQTKQLEGLVRLIQGMSSALQPNIYPRAGTSASFSAAGHPPNTISYLNTWRLLCQFSVFSTATQDFVF